MKWIASITINKDGPRKDTYFFNTLIAACNFLKRITWSEEVLEAHITREE